MGTTSMSHCRIILPEDGFKMIVNSGCVRLYLLLFYFFLDYNTMGMQSHYRPRQTQRVPGGWGDQISRQLAHEDGKVVSPTHRPPLPPRKYSRYSFLLEAESTPGAIVRPEGLCHWNIPITPSGIEPMTFQLVAQCLNQLCHRVPHNGDALPKN